MRSMSRPLTAAFGLMFAVACAANNPGVIIEGIKPPLMGCMYEVDIDFLTAPVLDTSSASLAVRPLGLRYAMVVQVVNQMLDLYNPTYPLMADPNHWTAEEAEIELRDLTGSALQLDNLPNPYRVPATGFALSAEDADTPGRGLIYFEAIPANYGARFADQSTTIIVGITLRGTTAGGSTQTSGEYSFPLTLCNGCLFQCVRDEMGMPETSLSCLPGQDQISLVCLEP